MMKAGTTQTRRQVPDVVQRVLTTAGRPLDAPTQSLLEARMGRSFRDVRVHADAEAARSAHAVHAAAYTVGERIVFAEGRYRPDTLPGLHLLAHEVAHVVQQGPASGAAGRPARVSDDGHACEVDARRVATAVTLGTAARPTARASRRTLHRHKDDLVAYEGGQRALLSVVDAGKLVYGGTSVSGHVGTGEHEKGAGPIPAGWYTLHPGVTRPTVTRRQGGVCGANAIPSGYQEITADDEVPCAAGSAHYCNVSCPTGADPLQMCWTPKDCWGPRRIKIEGSTTVKVPPPGKGTVTRNGFYIHGGNPADAVSSGCVKALDNDVFDHIRRLTGVKGAVPLCVGAACGDAVVKATARSLSDMLERAVDALTP